VVQETAFARLKTAEDGYVEAIFPGEGPAALQEVLESGDAILRAHFGGRIERFAHHHPRISFSCGLLREGAKPPAPTAS
jgi:hypothetical protein